MRDIELSSRKVPVEGIFGYMKPLFSLSDGEFGQRCISCAMSYLCLDMTFARLLDVSLSEMSVQCGHIVDQIGMPSFFGEESLDVSTASAPGTHLPVTESPNRTFNSGARDAYANNYEDPQMGVIGGGSIEGSHLGALEGHCNKNHPFFVTMRRMWSSPDLYAVFWINMFLGGYIFIKQAFVKHLYETVAPILSLSLMAKLIMLCWLCSILMSVGITICRSVAVGVLDKSACLPTLCLSGYIQIPLVVLIQVTLWNSVFMYYIPAMTILLWLLQMIIFLCFCASTVSAVVIFVPALPDRGRDLTCKASSALVACVIHCIFFFWLQSYI